jgi:hypothetical protein
MAHANLKTLIGLRVLLTILLVGFEILFRRGLVPRLRVIRRTSVTQAQGLARGAAETLDQTFAGGLVKAGVQGNKALAQQAADQCCCVRYRLYCWESGCYCCWCRNQNWFTSTFKKIKRR